MSVRRFVLVEGASAKFWEVALEGRSVTVRFGRLGTHGQTKTKSFPTPEKAQQHHDRLVKEKVKKGYSEKGREATGASKKSPAKKRIPKKETSKQAASFQPGGLPSILIDPPWNTPPTERPDRPDPPRVQGLRLRSVQGAVLLRDAERVRARRIRELGEKEHRDRSKKEWREELELPHNSVVFAPDAIATEALKAVGEGKWCWSWSADPDELEGDPDEVFLEGTLATCLVAMDRFGDAIAPAFAESLLDGDLYEGARAKGSDRDLALEEWEWALRVFERIDSAHLAPAVAEALVLDGPLAESCRALAARWCARHVEAACMGLIPFAVDATSPRQQAAAHALGYLASVGEADVIRDHADGYGSKARAAVDSLLEEDQLLTRLPAKAPKLPAFCSRDELPPPLLRDGTALPPDAVQSMTTMLAFTDAAVPYAGLQAVREVCRASSLARFGRALCDAWRAAGEDKKALWVLRTLALFGDDETARYLADLAIHYRKQNNHARAVISLDVLARLATPAALKELRRLAADSALAYESETRAKALAFLLAVPPLGQGFDDLESVMVNSDRWPYEDWLAAMDAPGAAEHGTNVLWAAYEARAPRVAFRLDADSTPVDHRGKKVPLRPSDVIGVVHPAELSPEELDTWVGVFEEQGLEQTFAQLSRPVHRPSPEEAMLDHLVRFEGLSAKSTKLHHFGRQVLLPGQKIYDRIYVLGWTIELKPGISAARPNIPPEQTVMKVRTNDGQPIRETPIAYSELIRDLERVFNR